MHTWHAEKHSCQVGFQATAKFNSREDKFLFKVAHFAMKEYAKMKLQEMSKELVSVFN